MRKLIGGPLLAFATVCLAAGLSSGCGDEDGSGGGGGGNSALQSAANDACDNAVDCAEQQGVQLNRDQVCTGYSSYGALTGGSCVSAATNYLNCIADAPCDDFDSCQSLSEAAGSACERN